MALAEPLAPVDYISDNISKQGETFDINLLCAKLEAAKYEQEALQWRTRYEQAVGREQDAKWIADDDNRFMQSPTNDVNAESQIPNRRSWQQLSPEAKKAYAKKVLPVFNKPREHQPVQDHARPGLSRPSTDDASSIRMRSQVDKRRSGAGFPISYDGRDTRGDSVAPKRPDVAKRRSKTAPLQIGKLPLQHGSLTTFECTEMPIYSRPVEEHSYSSIGLVNEFCISYDLVGGFEELTPKKEKPNRRSKIYPESEKREGGERLRSMSLLSLPLMLKKDKTEVKEEEEVMPTIQEGEETKRAHTRQKSLPIKFGDSAVRPKEDRARKRDSFIGFLKKF